MAGSVWCRGIITHPAPSVNAFSLVDCVFSLLTPVADRAYRRRMSLMTSTEIEAKARAQGISINEMCRRAGIAASIFYLWKAGKSQPNMRSYEAMVAVVDQPRKPEAAA